MNLFENINIERFLYSLKYMWQGMLCIFLVIGVIILSTVLMNFISAKSEEKRQLKKETENKDK